MKRIACLNTMLTSSEDTKTSEQLIDMFNSARIYNKEQNVRGVVLVSKDVILQILEGESNTLAELIYRLNRDKMTKDTSVILNSDIDESFFNGWQIKLLNDKSEKNDRYLKKIHTLISKQLKVSAPLDEQRLASFFSTNQHPIKLPSITKDQPEKKQLNHSASRFFDYHVSLTAWPKPSQLKPTPELFKLCSYLSRRETLYQDLLVKHIFDSHNTLDNHLERLDNIGLLVSKPHVANNPAEIKIQKKSNTAIISSPVDAKHGSGSSDRFSQVLRKFIASAKRIR